MLKVTPALDPHPDMQYIIFVCIEINHTCIKIRLKYFFSPKMHKTHVVIFLVFSSKYLLLFFRDLAQVYICSVIDCIFASFACILYIKTAKTIKAAQKTSFLTTEIDLRQFKKNPSSQKMFKNRCSSHKNISLTKNCIFNAKVGAPFLKSVHSILNFYA